MLENIEVLCHSSIKISKEKVIYVDPYKIDKNYNDADMIFITHAHYDHYSSADIDKVRKDNTIIIGTEDLQSRFLKDGFSEDRIKIVSPNNVYVLEKISFETVPAYNINKPFHPKRNGWVRLYYRIRWN